MHEIMHEIMHAGQLYRPREVCKSGWSGTGSPVSVSTRPVPGAAEVAGRGQGKPKVVRGHIHHHVNAATEKNARIPLMELLTFAAFRPFETDLSGLRRCG